MNGPVIPSRNAAIDMMIRLFSFHYKIQPLNYAGLFNRASLNLISEHNLMHSYVNLT